VPTGKPLPADFSTSASKTQRAASQRSSASPNPSQTSSIGYSALKIASLAENSKVRRIGPGSAAAQSYSAARHTSRAARSDSPGERCSTSPPTPATSLAHPTPATASPPEWLIAPTTPPGQSGSPPGPRPIAPSNSPSPAGLSIACDRPDGLSASV